MSVLGAFHVNTASTASGSGLTPCLSTILPRYLFVSLRISHFDGSHAIKDLIEPIDVVCQGGCCNDRVIHVTHHKIPVLLSYSGQSLSHQSLEDRRGVAQAKGHPLLLVQPQFTCESGLFSVLLPQRDPRRQNLSPVW